MDQHPADRAPDQPQVDPADPVDHRKLRLRRQLVNRADRKALAGARVTRAARLGQVVLVDVRFRMPRGQDVVDAVARTAIGHRRVARPRGQPVEAVLVGRYRVRDVVLVRQAQVAMTTAAGHLGDVRCENRRGLDVRREDPVLAVAVRADRRFPRAVLCRDPVNALLKGLRDLGVAFAAGVRDVGVEDLRSGVARRVQRVGAVAVVAGCRVLAFLAHAEVNAVVVGLDRLGHRDSVLLDHFRIRVAGTTSLRQLQYVNRRFRIRRGH